MLKTYPQPWLYFSISFPLCQLGKAKNKIFLGESRKGSDSMLKTGIRKIDHFKLYYWHDAILIGKYKLPKLKPTQFVPPYDKVVGFNERNGIKNPSEYWIDYFIYTMLWMW